MSGHSKWAQIKRQKGVADIKRGQAFTKLANAISIAVREGGGVGDPDSNFRLRLAIDRARTLNMPKANIERAIERGKGTQDQENFEEVVYEGFGPGGIAIIVEAVTDNKLRTTSEVKNIIEKNGGTLATPGSVSYQFEQKGMVTVKKDSKSFDDIFMLVLDTGAEDLEDLNNEVVIYTDPHELMKVKEKVSKDGLNIQEAELIRKPITIVSIQNQDLAQKIISFIDKIESLDDVQKVYSNFDIDDQILNQIKTA